MKTFLTLVLLALIVTTSFSEEGKFSKKKEGFCLKFNKLYDSIYTAKVFHGADSVKALKRLNDVHQKFNTAK